MFTSTNNPKAKLTLEQVKQIQNLIKKGIPGRDISEQFNISTSTVSRIKNKQIWQERR